MKQEDKREFAKEFAASFYSRKPGEPLPGQIDYIGRSIEMMSERITSHNAAPRPAQQITGITGRWEDLVNPADVYPANRRWNGD